MASTHPGAAAAAVTRHGARIINKATAANRKAAIQSALSSGAFGTEEGRGTSLRYFYRTWNIDCSSILA